MLAGEIYGHKQIRLIDVDEPTLENSPGGDIIFQPELGCLCGSDLLYYEADYPTYPPEIGHSLHELIGTVVDTNGSKFKVGDRVLCVPYKQLGMQERFVVTENQAIYVDDRKPVEQALMAQPLGTVLYALRKLPSIVGWNVAVVGQGPMGQLFNVTLRQLGANQIIGCDIDASRLKTSPSMGATDTVLVDPDDDEGSINKVKDALGGELPDLVIEVVGHREQVLNFCIKMCRPYGTVFFFGVPPETVPEFNIFDFFWKNLTMYTTVGPDFGIDFPLAMRWISEGRVDVSPICTHHMKLQDIQEAFEVFQGHKDGALKVLLDFPARG